LSHKIELIKAGVQARKLSEQAEKIQKDILKLGRRFTKIEGLWSTLFETHMKNLRGKAEDFDSEWKQLKDEFKRIEMLYEE
jgi:uncharacterized protein (DUF3084 family)